MKQTACSIPASVATTGAAYTPRSSCDRHSTRPVCFSKQTTPAPFVPPTQAISRAARDHGRRRVAVLGCSRHLAVLAEERGAEVFAEIGAPELMAIGHAQTLQFAQARLGVNPVLVHEGRAARTRRALLIFEDVIDGRAPEWLSVASLDGVNRLPGRLIIEVKRFPAGDNWRSKPFPNLHRQMTRGSTGSVEGTRDPDAT